MEGIGSPVTVVPTVSSPSPQRKSSTSNSASGRRNRYTCNKLKLKTICCGCSAKRGCVIAEALVEDDALQIFENIFSSKREEIEDFFDKCVSGSQQTKIAREKQFILDLLNENRGPSASLQSVADAAQAQSETEATLQTLNEYANLHQMDIATITNFANGGTDKGLEDSKLSPKGNVQPIKKRPRLSAIKLRVYKLLVEHNGVSIVVNFEGASMEELQLAVASKLNLNAPIIIEYLDRDFNRFVSLNQLNELRDKMILRVKPAQITTGPFHNPKALEKYEIPSSSLEKLMFVEEDWFAQTWRGRWHSNEGSHFVCIKQIYLDTNSTTSLITEAKSDIQQLCEIRVQQLINMYGYAVDPLQHSVFIVNEWVDGGSLLDLLHSRQELSEIDRLRLCHEAVTAVNYLHHMEIIHGDIRSANFWVDRSLGYRLKLADFGFLKVQLNMLALRNQLSKAKSNTLLTVGSPRWRAPETFSSIPQWTKFADIYSLGMVLYEIVARQIPFADLDDAQVIYAVSVEQKQPQFPLSVNCSVTLQQLIQQCWHTTPEARPTNFSLSQTIYTIVEMHTKGGNKE